MKRFSMNRWLRRFLMFCRVALYLLCWRTWLVQGEDPFGMPKGGEEIQLSPGREFFRYYVYWKSIIIGEAKILITQKSWESFPQAHYLFLSGGTSKWGKSIYDYDIIACSYLSPDKQRVLYHRINSGEKGKRKVREISANWGSREIRYVKNYQDDRGWRKLNLSEDQMSCVDPLGVFLFLRDLAEKGVFENQKEIIVVVTDGKREGEGRIIVQDKEEIVWNKQTRVAWLLFVDLGKIEGLFRTPGNYNLKIWIGMPPNPLIYRLEGEAIIGRCVAELQPPF